MARHTPRTLAVVAVLCVVAAAAAAHAAHAAPHRVMISTASPTEAAAGGRRRVMPGADSTLTAQLTHPHAGLAPAATPVVLHFALNHDHADRAAKLVRTTPCVCLRVGVACGGVVRCGGVWWLGV